MEIGGKKVKTWWLIAGGGVAVVGVWFLYRKGASGSSSSSSGTSSSGIDPLTGLPSSQDNQVDPVTGMTYLEEAQQYGSIQAAEAAVTSGSGYYGSATGAYGYGSSYGPLDSGYPTISGLSSAPVGNSFSSNAAWAQAVTSGLVSLGYSSTDVAAALGLFFAQQPLGSGSDGVSYASIIQAAEAEYGPPPQGTYNIIPEPTNSGGGGTGGGTPPPKQTATDPTSVHGIARYTNATISWSGGKAPNGYEVYLADSAGKTIKKDQTSGTRTSYTFGSLKTKTHYKLGVYAKGAKEGAKYVDVTTR